MNMRQPPAVVRVYTVCDESKYLIIRNVPALGCGDELFKLFGSYGEVEECKPMEAEDFEQFTDLVCKEKLDDHVFLGKRLEVSYASQFESLSDTKDNLEGRRREVLARLNRGRFKGSTAHDSSSVGFNEPLLSGTPSQANYILSPTVNITQRDTKVWQHNSYSQDSSSNVLVTSDKAYFPLQSMNQTVQLVREKLNKIQSSAEHLDVGVSKKLQVDNRRRI